MASVYRGANRLCCSCLPLGNHTLAVPWLRRSVAGLLARRPVFDPGSVHVGFVVDELALGQVFPPSTSVFPLSISFH